VRNDDRVNGKQRRLCPFTSRARGARGTLEQMRALLANVDAGARDIYDRAAEPSASRFRSGCPKFRCVLALRRTDLRSLQTALMPLGLSSRRAACGRILKRSSSLARDCGEPVNRPATTAGPSFRGERFAAFETARSWTRNARTGRANHGHAAPEAADDGHSSRRS